jgi:glycosyltransferase involved in cell wall biosynthesis
VAVAVNIIAPYRKPLYEALGREFDVTVFCSGQEGNRKDWGNVAAGLAGVTVKQSWGMTMEVARRGDRGQLPDRRYLHATPGLMADLIKFDPDAVITNEMGARTGVALAYGTWHRKPVWIWWGGTRHTERHIGRPRKVVRGLISRWGKRWFSYGQTSSEYLRTLGIPGAQIVELQNCVDERLYERPSPAAVDLHPRPVLLYVGRLTLRKGLELLLHSAARLQKCGHRFSLLLVGSGPDRAAMEELVKEIGLQNTVFHPPQPPSAMPAIYRSADCLVFPTLEDVWGLVVNEALWSGIPVLSSVYAGCTPGIVPPENRFDPLQPDDCDRALLLAVNKRLAPPDRVALKRASDVAAVLVRSIWDSLKSCQFSVASSQSGQGRRLLTTVN